MDNEWVGAEQGKTGDDEASWFMEHKVCPVCRSQATVKWDKIGPGYIISLCRDCGRFIITEECCEELQEDRTGLLHEKAKRWLRETGRHNELRMLSPDPGRVNDPEITEYMDLVALRGMYESSGSEKEYDQVLTKLAQYCIEGSGYFFLGEVLHCFPSVHYDQTLVVLAQMEEQGHVRPLKTMDGAYYVTKLAKSYLDRSSQDQGRQSTAGELVGVFEHSDDYRCVWLHGKQLPPLSHMQGEVVCILDEARIAGKPVMSHAAILSKMKSPPVRLSDIFRSGDPRTALIQRLGRDNYKLNV